MRFRHVIWDYDGTLFNSYPVMAAAFSDALLKLGISEPVNAIETLMKDTMGAAIRHYREKYQLDDAFLGQFKILSANAEGENTKPFDGVVDLCGDICKSGGKNYLFTHRGESALYFMERYGLMANFTELITSKQNFPRKPGPEAILYLIDKYGFSPDEAIMIGDRDLDILSARNAGIHSCFFAGGNEASGIAEFNIDCLLELYTILDIDVKAGQINGSKNSHSQRYRRFIHS